MALEHTNALIGGLRQFRVAGDSASAEAREAVSATPALTSAASLFGDCRVYIPAHEWEAVDRARGSSKRIVVKSLAEGEAGSKEETLVRKEFR